MAHDTAKLTALRSYVSTIIGDIKEDELTIDEFRHVVNKSLSMYNAYTADEKELIAIIQGTLLNQQGGYMFAPPYPSVATATPEFAGLNWWSEVAIASCTYDPTTGMLTVPMTGTYIVKYGMDVTLDTINMKDHPLFYRLLEAHYKIIVGNRRKKFALTDYQITNDGDTMVQDGTTLLEEVKQDLEDNTPFWLGLVTR